MLVIKSDLLYAEDDTRWSLDFLFTKMKLNATETVKMDASIDTMR
jgi:hypothetical protein